MGYREVVLDIAIFLLKGWISPTPPPSLANPTPLVPRQRRFHTGQPPAHLLEKRLRPTPSHTSERSLPSCGHAATAWSSSIPGHRAPLAGNFGIATHAQFYRHSVAPGPASDGGHQAPTSSQRIRRQRNLPAPALLPPSHSSRPTPCRTRRGVAELQPPFLLKWAELPGLIGRPCWLVDDLFRMLTKPHVHLQSLDSGRLNCSACGALQSELQPIVLRAWELFF